MTDPRLASGNFRGSTRSAYVGLSRERDFALGKALVRPSGGEIAIGGEVIRLQPRVMQVLVALVRAEGEVVSRDQLVASCWGGIAIGDDAINRCIGRLRRLAETEAPGAFEIVTLSRIGYRLVRGNHAAPNSPIEVQAGLLGDEAPATPEQATPSESVPPRHSSIPALRWWLAGFAAVTILAAALLLLAPRRPEAPPRIYTVAVLPIRNLTGDVSLDRAADKLTEDVRHVLGRGGYLFVAPWDATQAWEGKAVDDRLLGKSLHVREVVNASLRKSDAGYRVGYQIVDTVNDQVLDSQDIGQSAADGSLPEHALAMMMFEDITDVLHRRWRADELGRPADDGDPDNLLARIEKLEGDVPGQKIAQVERLTRIADKVISPGQSLRSVFEMDTCWYYAGLVDRRVYSSPAQRLAWADTALDAARRALDARPHTTSPHSCRAEVFGLLGRWAEGMAEANYIMTNFPLTVVGYEALANLDLERGRFREALQDFLQLTRMSGESCNAELGEAGGCQGELGLMHLFLGEKEAAITEFRQQAVEEQNGPFAPFFLTAALELSGDHGSAVTSAALYRRLKTDDSIWRMLTLSNEPAFLAAAQTVRAALHRAGLDEPAEKTKLHNIR